jgi:hypothetical protein
VLGGLTQSTHCEPLSRNHSRCASAPAPDKSCTNVTLEWFDIPLSAMLPRKAEASNLIVAAALAASSVAASAVRIESMFLGTGTAAGVTAAAAVQRRCAVQDVPVGEVQAALTAQYGQVVHGPPTGGGRQASASRG